MSKHSIHDIALPEAIIGFYDWSLVIDHQEKVTWLVNSLDQNDKRLAIVRRILDAVTESTINQVYKHQPFKITRNFRSNITKQKYAESFRCLQKHIFEGDCYEANLCQRFTANYVGSPWQAYKVLREKNPTPFAAFMPYPQGTLLCLSPERFIRVQDGHAETKPIKGTAPRFQDVKQDAISAKQLLNSEKDKAENLMIVDLLRNDFGKTCIPGSIKVPKLFELESFPNVHHLVSTITGQIDPQYHALDILRNAFPGGSITGAPKHRVMEIIEDLEPHHRSVYCGSIGYFDVNGNMDSNIVIRTLICCEQKIHGYAGGAIVSDSELESEYEETLMKIRNLITALEGI